MQDQLNQLIKLLKLDTLDKNQNLKFIKDKTGINPSVAALALGIFFAICIINSSATKIIIGLACFVAPAYLTFEALQSQQKEDDIKYLTYWITFGILQIFCPILSWLMTPLFYIILRISITAVLLHPSTNLAVKVYFQLIEPMLKDSQKIIDKGLNKAQNLLNQGKNKLNVQVGKMIKKQ